MWWYFLCQNNEIKEKSFYLTIVLQGHKNQMWEDILQSVFFFLVFLPQTSVKVKQVMLTMTELNVKNRN